jgi:hypothetical protein
MNTVAYIIIFIDNRGVIRDAQIASEFPVTQMRNSGMQVCLLKAHGIDYGKAQKAVYAMAEETCPWVLKHRTISMQRESDARMKGIVMKGTSR